MKTKFNGILTLLLALVVQISFAQERTITGTVSDETGPLPGVSVLKKGTAIGTETDFDGKYAIQAKTGDVLVFSFVGMETIEKTIGTSNNINISMQEDSENVLDEVVVTAQGIKREKKALGYAVSTIGVEQIESKPETDIAKILTGKVAGVQVNASGGFLGNSPSVIIRAKNSINGSNQPLYVINGVPITGDRSFDIDPNNIASTSVLKGLAASTLYGEEGKNGVILITTKTGQSKDRDEKFEIELSHTTSFTEIGNLPDFQNTYGQGSDNTINTTFFGTWGARFDGQIVPHPLSIDAYANNFPQFQGATVVYQAAPNNVSDFFDTGTGSQTSLFLSKNTEDASISMNISNSSQTGYIEQNFLDRLSISLGGNIKFTNNLELNSNVTYTRTNSNQPTRNLFTLLTWIPRNLDIQNLPFQDPNTGESVYYRTSITNPRWQLNNTGFNELNNRVTANATLKYNFNEKYSLAYTYGLDYYNEKNEDFINKGGTNSPLGAYQVFFDVNSFETHRLNFFGNNIPISDSFSINGQVGFESRSRLKRVDGIVGTDQGVFGVNVLTNFREHAPILTDELGFGSSKRNVIGLYGSLDLSYNKYLYLTLSGRNDWVSSLESQNNSIFYPSVSLSFLPTDAFPSLKGENGNNFLKLRAGFGTSASFPRPYLTRPTLASSLNAFINPNDGSVIPFNALNPFLPNPDLKASLTREFEAGVEGKYFNNWLGFDVSVYKRIVDDQILFPQLPNSTGYTSTVINAGTLETKGIEVGLNLNPFQAKEAGDFSWNINTNFNAYESTITELPVERVNISSGVNFAIEGQPYGVFRGTYAVKDADGNLLINPSTGKIISSNSLGLEDQLIGDPNEDFTLNTINTLSYKNFTLSAQLDYTHGGDIFSNTASNLLRRGVTTDTVDREGSFIIPGVLGDPSTGQAVLDANGNSIPNNIQINANDLYFLNLQDVSENLVYDATTIRLRDVTLGYNMPDKFLKNTPFGSVRFTASANNLWWYTPNIPKGLNLDPEVLVAGGNARGIDSQNAPSYKQYSFNVKLTF